MDQNEQKELRVYFSEIRAKGNRIVGEIPYGSLSEDLGGFREKLRPGVFGESLKSGKPIYMLWGHDRLTPVASTANGSLTFKDTARALTFEAHPADTSGGKDLIQNVKAGLVTGTSFGFVADKDSWSTDSGGGSVRTVEVGTLLEVSPTLWPAYPEAKVSARTLKNISSRERKPMTEERKKKIDQYLKGEFRNSQEWVKAVMLADYPGEIPDGRLRATGLSEGIGADGGFAVQSDFALKVVNEFSDIVKRCFRISITTNSNGIKLGLVDSGTSQGLDSEYGGAQCYWEAEASEKTASYPKSRIAKLQLHKMIGLAYATDELLEDSDALEGVLVKTFGNVLNAKLERAIFRGSGAGQPLGAIRSAACKKVTRSSPGNVTTDDIAAMVASFPESSIVNRDSFFAGPSELLDPLSKLTVSAGAGGGSGLPLWSWRQGNQKYNKLSGFDFIPSPNCSAKGTYGDLLLFDPSQYLLIDKKVRTDISMHVRFIHDEKCFRVVYRIDGQPVLAKPLLPRSGSSVTISPFVALN